MRSSQHLRRRILRHLLAGGAVLSTGCIVDDQVSNDPDTDASQDASRGPDVGVPVDASPFPDASAPADASPIPDAELVGVPPGDEPLPTPNACEDAFCEPLNSDGLCRTTDNVAERYAFEGSGCCQWEVLGPYAANPDADPSRPCCYFVPGEGCEGRPFYVAAEHRQAPVTHRTDWC